jgi:hypothetical protein
MGTAEKYHQRQQQSTCNHCDSVCLATILDHVVAASCAAQQFATAAVCLEAAVQERRAPGAIGCAIYSYQLRVYGSTEQRLEVMFTRIGRRPHTRVALLHTFGWSSVVSTLRTCFNYAVASNTPSVSFGSLRVAVVPAGFGLALLLHAPEPCVEAEALSVRTGATVKAVSAASISIRNVTSQQLDLPDGQLPSMLRGACDHSARCKATVKRLHAASAEHLKVCRRDPGHTDAWHHDAGSAAAAGR